MIVGSSESGVGSQNKELSIKELPFFKRAAKIGLKWMLAK
jgi:hypothetical protein